MVRSVFFSFHYQRDIWRINQIRNLPNVVDRAAAGFADKSLWEESKAKGDSIIKKLIDDGLYGTSVTVVCIGYQTAGRKFINYEIQKSIERGNGIVGVRINHLRDRFGATDPMGNTPTLLTSYHYPVYDYLDHPTLKRYIDEAATAAGR